MKIIEPSFEILYPRTHEECAKMMDDIETAGRTCYKSEKDPLRDVQHAGKFVKRIIKNGHEAMLEFGKMTVKFTVDRGVSHELVRHRMASFAQESTRFCNYSKDKFENEITVIRPIEFKPGTNEYDLWEAACQYAETAYMYLLYECVPPEMARSVLPNSLKTEVIMSANLREWRHFFELRALGTTGKPHPQMNQVAFPLLEKAAEMMPSVFDDLLHPTEGYKVAWRKTSDVRPQLVDGNGKLDVLVYHKNFGIQIACVFSVTPDSDYIYWAPLPIGPNK